MSPIAKSKSVGRKFLPVGSSPPLGEGGDRSSVYEDPFEDSFDLDTLFQGSSGFVNYVRAFSSKLGLGGDFKRLSPLLDIVFLIDDLTIADLTTTRGRVHLALVITRWLRDGSGLSKLIASQLSTFWDSTWTKTSVVHPQAGITEKVASAIGSNSQLLYQLLRVGALFAVGTLAPQLLGKKTQITKMLQLAMAGSLLTAPKDLFEAVMQTFSGIAARLMCPNDMRTTLSTADIDLAHLTQHLSGACTGHVLNSEFADIDHFKEMARTTLDTFHRLRSDCTVDTSPALILHISRQHAKALDVVAKIAGNHGRKSRIQPLGIMLWGSPGCGKSFIHEEHMNCVSIVNTGSIPRDGTVAGQSGGDKYMSQITQATEHLTLDDVCSAADGSGQEQMMHQCPSTYLLTMVSTMPFAPVKADVGSKGTLFPHLQGVYLTANASNRHMDIGKMNDSIAVARRLIMIEMVLDPAFATDGKLDNLKVTAYNQEHGLPDTLAGPFWKMSICKYNVEKAMQIAKDIKTQKTGYGEHLWEPISLTVDGQLTLCKDLPYLQHMRAFHVYCENYFHNSNEWVELGQRTRERPITCCSKRTGGTGSQYHTLDCDGSCHLDEVSPQCGEVCSAVLTGLLWFPYYCVTITLTSFFWYSLFNAIIWECRVFYASFIVAPIPTLKWSAIKVAMRLVHWANIRFPAQVFRVMESIVMYNIAEWPVHHHHALEGFVGRRVEPTWASRFGAFLVRATPGGRQPIMHQIAAAHIMGHNRVWLSELGPMGRKITKGIFAGISLAALLKAVKILVHLHRAYAPQGAEFSKPAEVERESTSAFPSSMFSHKNTTWNVPSLTNPHDNVSDVVKSSSLTNSFDFVSFRRGVLRVQGFKDGVAVTRSRFAFFLPVAAGPTNMFCMGLSPAHIFTNEGEPDTYHIDGRVLDSQRFTCKVAAHLVLKGTDATSVTDVFDENLPGAAGLSDAAFFPLIGVGGTKSMIDRFIKAPPTQTYKTAVHVTPVIESAVISWDTVVTSTSTRKTIISNLGGMASRRLSIPQTYDYTSDVIMGSRPGRIGECGNPVLCSTTGAIIGIHTCGSDGYTGVTVITTGVVHKAYAWLSDKFALKDMVTVQAGNIPTVIEPNWVGDHCEKLAGKTQFGFGQVHPSHGLLKIPLDALAADVILAATDGVLNTKHTTNYKVSPFVNSAQLHISDVEEIMATLHIPKHNPWEDMNLMTEQTFTKVQVGDYATSMVAFDSLNKFHIRAMARVVWTVDSTNQHVFRSMHPFFSEDFVDDMVAGRLPREGTLLEIKPGPLAQVLSGFSGTGGGSINVNTSCGYGLPGKKSRYMERVFLDPEVLEYAQRTISSLCPIEFKNDEAGIEAEQLYHECDAKVRSGMSLGTIFVVFLKDEVRKISKKRRTISCGSMILVLLMRKYFHPLIGIMASDAPSFGTCVGMDACGTDWERIYENVTSSSGSFDGDYKAFDKRLSGFSTSASFFVLRNMASCLGYSKHDLTAMSALSVDIVNPRYNIAGAVVQVGHSNPSGHMLTTWLNCMANNWIIRYCFFAGYHDHVKRVVTTQGDMVRVRDPDVMQTVKYEDYASAVTYGDDLLVSCTERVPYFNQVSMAKYCSELSLDFTSADKTLLLTEYVPDHKLTLLNRSFVPYHLGTRCVMVLAPLAVNSILKPLVFGEFSQGVIEQTATNIQSAVREFFQHGPIVYETRLRELKAFASECQQTRLISKGKASTTEAVLDCMDFDDFPSWEMLALERINSSGKHVLTLEEVHRLVSR